MLEPGRLLRIRDIIGDPKKNIRPIIPVARSTWWLGVSQGRFPQPVKLGGVTAWRAEDIAALIQHAKSQK